MFFKKINRIAFVVGHNFLCQGAKAYNGITEYDYNSHVAEIYNGIFSTALPKKEVKFFKAESPIDRDGMVDAVNYWLPDLVIELHFNASGIPHISGTEGLVIAGDNASKRLCSKLCSMISKDFNTRLRHDKGVLGITKGDRGFFNLLDFKDVKYKFIIEPEFFDFKTRTSIQFIDFAPDYAWTLKKFTDSI